MDSQQGVVDKNITCVLHCKLLYSNTHIYYTYTDVGTYNHCSTPETHVPIAHIHVHNLAGPRLLMRRHGPARLAIVLQK